MTQPLARPALRVPSGDGTRIAVFVLSAPEAAGPAAATPILLVHGTGSDHTTWRVTGPILAARRPAYALDRRGRGSSGDGPRYSAGLELADIAAVAASLAERHGGPVAVLGHSLGGRLALAASRGSGAIGRVAAYESAPGAPGDAAAADHEGLLERLRGDIARGEPDAALARFLAEGAGLPAADLAAFRATPLWAERVATVPTIVRELDAALHDPAIGGDALAGVEVPVLQLAGSASPAWFRDGAAALHTRLADGRLEVIDGARHGAHHTHAGALADAIERFLAR